MGNRVFEPDHHMDIAWCPACGNFGILGALKMALEELGLRPENTVITSGIGQAAKTPQYVKAHFFNGLHGRSLPLACGIKVANPFLTVIAESGDGDTYGEGGSHFLHAIRRNSDITNIVHNNMIYGLTKGQASPTTQEGMMTPIHVRGVYEKPFNPVAVALSLGASFVARANIGDLVKTKEIFKRAIQHKGYALVDVFQPCVVFNKLNTYQWFKEHTYYVDESYDAHDRVAVFSRIMEEDRLPIGILYEQIGQKTFEEHIGVYESNADPLFRRRHNLNTIRELIAEYAK